MKIRKVQLARLLKNMMEAYNAFTTDESLASKTEGWYDKLQYQDEEHVSKSFYYWNGAKMPTAIEILKKCFDMRTSDKNDPNKKEPCNFVCEYNKFIQSEEECEFFNTDKYRNDFEIIGILGFRDGEDKTDFLACLNHSCDIRLKISNKFRYYQYGFLPG